MSQHFLNSGYTSHLERMIISIFSSIKNTTWAAEGAPEQKPLLGYIFMTYAELKSRDETYDR